MKQPHFSDTIEAPKDAVWRAMLGAETYKEWTEPFREGSYYEGSWSTADRL